MIGVMEDEPEEPLNSICNLKQAQYEVQYKQIISSSEEQCARIVKHVQGRMGIQTG